MSRTALLDIFVMFWTLAAFGLHPDRPRPDAPRLAARVAAAGPPDRRIGPGLGWRPWRIPAAVCLGLAAAPSGPGCTSSPPSSSCRCSGTSARGAPPAQNWLLGCVRDGDRRLRRSCRSPRAYWPPGPAGSSPRTATTASGARRTRRVLRLLPDSLRSCGSTTGRCTTSTSTWTRPTRTGRTRGAGWSWAARRLLLRDQEGPGRLPGRRCAPRHHPSARRRSGGARPWLMLVWMLGRCAATGGPGRSCPGWSAAACWLQYQHRTIFTFYTVAFVPWIVLIVTYVIGMALGPPTASSLRRPWSAARRSASMS